MIGLALGVPAMWRSRTSILLGVEAHPEGWPPVSRRREALRLSYLHDGELVTAGQFPVAPNIKNLYAHLLENGFIDR